MAQLKVWSPDAGLAHERAGHPERPERLRAAREGIALWGGDVAWEVAAPVEQDTLATTHTPAHVARIERACAVGAPLDPDTYTTPGSWLAARTAAGASIEAAESAANGRPAFALARPPGHHATRDRAMGFCMFNNAALAAQRLAERGLRVAIVDIDVHHGNGTQEIFYDRDDVFYASLHGAPLYPGTGVIEETGAGAGVGATLNLPLPAGTGHEGWLEAFRGAAVPAVRCFAPQVIVVSAGFDADHRDPLGNLRLVPATFHAAVSDLVQITPRIAVVLEGGYNLDAVREGVAATAAALVGGPPPPVERVPEGPPPWAALASRVARAHPGLVGSFSP